MGLSLDTFFDEDTFSPHHKLYPDQSRLKDKGFLCSSSPLVYISLYMCVNISTYMYVSVYISIYIYVCNKYLYIRINCIHCISIKILIIMYRYSHLFCIFLFYIHFKSSQTYKKTDSHYKGLPRFISFSYFLMYWHNHPDDISYWGLHLDVIRIV